MRTCPCCGAFPIGFKEPEPRIDIKKLAALIDTVRDDICAGSDGDSAAQWRALDMLADLSAHLKGKVYNPSYDFDIGGQNV